MTRASVFANSPLPAQIETFLTAEFDTATAGMTLGFIGFGPVAEELARRARAHLGMSVVVFDRTPIAAERLSAVHGRQVESVEALLPLCDVLSLHCEDRPEDHLVMTAARLDRMKETALLINTGCRNAVDEFALAQALWFGIIRGAVLGGVRQGARIDPALADCETFTLLPMEDTAPAPSPRPGPMRFSTCDQVA